MKNLNLIEFKNAYKELKELSGNKGFYIPLVKNIKLVDTQLEAFDLVKAPTKEFEKFLVEKDKLLIKYSNKEEDGDPKRTIEESDGYKYFKYDIPEENKPLLEKDGNALLEEYKDTLDEMKRREKAYIELMDEECTVEFHKIKEADLPNEMSPELFEIIEEFVE